MSNPTVTVKYRTKETHCSCCDQKLPEAKVSKFREFEIDKKFALSWVNWKDVSEFPEDMEHMIPEFIHETIHFFATSSGEKIIVEDSEVEKVKEFILREVTK